MRRNRTFIGPQGMGGMVSLWGASSIVKSIQYIAVAITGSNTSGTATINSVDTSSTILIPAGFVSAGDTTALLQNTLTTSILTNATTVTGNKHTGSATYTPQAIYMHVLEFMPGIIKSVQYATWTFVGGTSGDFFTINSVNTAKAVNLFTGARNAAGYFQPRYQYDRIYFNSATQLGILSNTDPYGSGYDSYPVVIVVEFF